MSMTPAMESIFANAQQNAASLIETATLAINAKVNTIEEAEQMIQELSSEAVKYNELLTTIMNAMRQVESGDMQKEEAAGIIAPAVKELKDKCTALKIANAEAPGDDITEDEIAILRELIIGAKAAAEDRLVAIRLGDDDKVDPEVEAEVNTPDEAAEEGFLHNFIERRHQAKINKAKIDTFWDNMKDMKATAILNQFAKAAAPLFNDDSANIKGMIDEMVKADQKSGKDYTGKLSAKDYIVKNFGKHTLAIMPGTPEGLGCQHILAPVANHDGDCYFFKKEICEIMMNPVKKEEVAPAQEAYEAEVATEAAFLAAKYVNTNETKTAKALYVNAKKLYSMGSKDKALQYMKQAKSLYEKALDTLMKSGKFEKAERTEAFKKGSTSVSIRKNVTRTDSMSFNIARSSLESKIDRCTAHILQWTTKAGKETYQQTLDQLKADREQAKAAKKAAKATENYEMEGETTMENYSEFMYACESMMDELMLELASGAMEADGDEGGDTAPSTIGSKLRGAFSKLKTAVKHGDKKAADEANAEIKEEADKLAEVSDDDPKKDKMSTAAKVGLVAAAGVAATVGLANLGIALDNSAKKKGVTPKGASAQIIKAASAICGAIGKNKGTIAAAKAVSAASGAALGYTAGKAIGNKINDAKTKKAKAAADAAAEAFGLESYDVYEVIQEFFAPEEIDMKDMDSATEAAIQFTYALEEIYDNLEVATESQSWQAVKGLLGAKSRDARKAIKEGKKLAKEGKKSEAVAKFNEAKGLFGEQKTALQRLPKDMWDTISSWLTVGWVPLMYSFIGEGGYKDAPNKNVNVAAVINYLNRAMKKCDELAKNAGTESEPEEKAEESLDAAMTAMLESFGISDDIDAAIKADLQ